MPSRKRDKLLRRLQHWCSVLVWLLALSPTSAQTFVFHLRTGDRITGSVVTEGTNEVRVAASFGGQVTIPLAQIERRETVLTNTATPPASATPNTPAPAAKPAAPPPASPKPATPPPAPPPKADATKPPQPSALWKFLTEWKGNADLGLNLGFGTKDRQTYTGRLQTTDAHPLANQHILKNSLDYIFSYGRIDGLLSENRMDGSWKVEYEVGKRFSVYNASGAGYDEVRRIDMQFDVGPGVGYKWITRTNFVLATELGGNYQEQFFSDNSRKQRYSLRLGEESWWQISSKLRLDEKLEFFPEITRLSDFRVRAESNLNYALRNNLTLKLTVIDLYESDPPAAVSNNDLQIRSSLSVKF